MTPIGDAHDPPNRADPSPPRESRGRILTLLGTFAFEPDAARASVSVRRKPRALLGYLAATGRWHTRRALAALICPEANDPSAALRSIISRMRQQFGADVIQADAERVRFTADGVDVDTRAVEARLAGDLDAVSDADLKAAVDRVGGEFLQGVTLSDAPEFELWLIGERARFRRLHRRGLRALIQRELADGRLDAAIERAQALITSDPLDEAAHADLMWLYARSGHRDAALSQFDTCREILHRELAVEPTRELTALRDEIEVGTVRRTRDRLRVSVTAPHLDPAREPPRAATYVGRVAELALLTASIDRLASGRGAVVLVAGEAGAGKTRLVEEAVARTGVRLLTGACYASSASRPYHPWIDLIEAGHKRIGTRAAEGIGRLTRRHLPMLVPALSGHWPSEDEPRGLATIGGDVEQILAAVADWLFSAAGDTPLVVFIDNLQWADASSLQLMQYLSGRVTEHPVLLLGAYRLDDATTGVELERLVLDLRRQQATVLTLSPFDAPDMERLVEDVWPSLVPADRRSIAERLVAATGGNPLFATEVLSHVREEEGLPGTVPIPPSVVEIVDERMAQLSDAARQALEAIAILGGPSTVAMVRAACGRSENDVADAIDAAIRVGLIRATSCDPVTGLDTSRASSKSDTFGTFDMSNTPRAATITDPFDEPMVDFRHDLLRDAVAGRIAAVRRRLLHRRIAIAYEGMRGPAARLAHHWEHAGDATRFSRYLRKAGEEAAEVYANDLAIDYLSRTIDLTTDTETVLGTTDRLASVLTRVGRREDACAALERGIEAADRASSTRWQAGLRAHLGNILVDMGYNDEALTRHEEARVLYETLGDRRRAGAQVGAVGVVHWRRGAVEKAMEAFEKALAVARELGIDEDIAIWSGNIGMLHVQRGRYDEGLASYRAALAITRRLNDRARTAIALGNIGAAQMDRGRYDEALVSLAEAFEIDRAIGHRSGAARHVSNLGNIYQSTGDDDHAWRCLVFALGEYVEMRERYGAGRVCGIAASVDADTGALDRALRWNTLSLGFFRSVEAAFLMAWQLYRRAEIQRKRGEYADALTAIRESMTLAGERDRLRNVASKVSVVRIEVAMGTASSAQGITELESVLSDCATSWDRAQVFAAMRRLDPSRDDIRERGARAMREMTPMMLSRRALALHEEFLGDEPTPRMRMSPPPESVPPLDDDVDRVLELALEHAERILEIEGGGRQLPGGE